MQQSKSKVTLAFLLTCFIIALTLTTCKSPKTSSYGEGELTWKEPIWKQTGVEAVKLRWKFVAGSKEQYNERLKATITSEGETKEWEHSVTLQYHVKNVSKEGTAQVLLSAKNLDTKGTGYELFHFLPRSLHDLGSFAISPSGHMTSVARLIGIRSLPTFPDDPVKLGSKWIDDVGIFITPILPGAIMAGKCTYHLVGLADVKGYKWAKISFEGELKLAKQEVMHKVIGVKWTEKPTKDGQGVSVGEIVAGSPAEMAGILQGDVILSFGDMSVNTWLDLIYVVAMSPHDRFAEVIFLRDGARKKLFVKPHVSSSGQIELNGSIKGVIVFDVTRGRVVQIQISPFSRKALIQVGEKTTEREARIY